MTEDRVFSKLTPTILASLKEIADDLNVLTGDDCESYSRDEAPHPRHSLPEVVIKPTSTLMVSRILRLADQHHIPVTPRGAGTGLSGGAVPLYGGISLCLEKMNRVIEIDEANFSATFEAGVVLKDLCSAVGEKGLYYPLYPGEMNATIGGNTATNAGGMRAVKYGVTRNFVLGLEAVLASGEIIQTGGKFVKSSTGYDLTQILIGSEGTLAVITQVTVKLITPPGSREILFVPFNSLDEAIRCVPMILKENILPVTIEFMCEDILKLVQEKSGKEMPFKMYPAYLLLMLECAGEDEFLTLTSKLNDICLRNGAPDVFVPGSESAKRRLLEFREQFYPTMQHCHMLDLADVVVPRSRIADFLDKVKVISLKHGIDVMAYGHAGDGNVHLHPVGAPETDPVRVQLLLKEIYSAGISLGGTISGEHGIGVDKKQYLPLAFTPAKIELMRQIKLAFDPHNILNPGKVI
jgi:glycolate oxidase